MEAMSIGKENSGDKEVLHKNTPRRMSFSRSSTRVSRGMPSSGRVSACMMSAYTNAPPVPEFPDIVRFMHVSCSFTRVSCSAGTCVQVQPTWLQDPCHFSKDLPTLWSRMQQRIDGVPTYASEGHEHEYLVGMHAEEDTAQSMGLHRLSTGIVLGQMNKQDAVC